MKISELETGKVYAKRENKTYSYTPNWGVPVSTEKLYKKLVSRRYADKVIEGRNVLMITSAYDKGRFYTGSNILAAIENVMHEFELPSYYSTLSNFTFSNGVKVSFELWTPAQVDGLYVDVLQRKEDEREAKDKFDKEKEEDVRNISQQMDDVQKAMGIDIYFRCNSKTSTVEISTSSMKIFLVRMEAIMKASPLSDGSL